MLTISEGRQNSCGNDVSNGRPPSAFEIYCEYVALKSHFNTKSFDYFKYGGKSRATKKAFAARDDAIHFFKMVNVRNWRDRLIANFAQDKNVWIGDIFLDNPGGEVYKDWRRRRDSLSYTFQLDLEKLPDEYEDVFRVDKGQHPQILTELMQGNICIETFAIMMKAAKVKPYWDANITDKFIAPNYIMHSEKYFPFIQHDRDKMKSIIKDRYF